MSKTKYKYAKGTAFIGRLIRLALGSYSVGKFKFARVLLNLFYKGKSHARGLQYTQTYIPNGQQKLRLVTYEDKATTTDKIALLWIHGGGYAMGIPEQDAPFAKKICRRAPIKMIMPDYTRSVEQPYPRGLEDCYVALKYVYDHADELGIAKDKIIVGGDSAGGGLTVALCLLARDRHEVKIAGQIPLYPMIDCRETESSRDNSAPVWDSRSNALAWDIYLRDVDRYDPPIYASPSRETNYEGMPPCITFVGELDPFLAETREYVGRLRDEGIPTYYEEYEGCYHGFDIVASRSDSAKRSDEFLLNSLLDMISKLK